MVFHEKFYWNPQESGCISVAEKFWIVDAETGQLATYAQAALNTLPKGSRLSLGQLGYSVISETDPCETMALVRTQLLENTVQLSELSKEFGFKIVREPVVEPIDTGIDLSHAPHVWTAGQHIVYHVRNRNVAVRVMKGMRLLMHFFLGMSGRSSYQEGDTEHRCSDRFFRLLKFSPEPVPPYMETWARFTQVAKDQHFIDKPTSCRWLLQISPHGGVELAICDVQPQLDCAVQLAALYKACCEWMLLSDSFASTPADEEAILEQIYLVAETKRHITQDDNIFLNELIQWCYSIGRSETGKLVKEMRERFLPGLDLEESMSLETSTPWKAVPTIPYVGES